jgi:hypothetical protein
MMRLLTRGIGLVAALLLLTLVRPADAAQNLLKNASFAAGDLNGWYFGSGDTYAARTPLSFTNIGGVMAVRLEYVGTNTNPNYLESEMIRLEPNTDYNLSVEVKGDFGGTASDRFEFYIINADQVRQGQSRTFYEFTSTIFTTSWVRYDHTFTTHTNADACVYFIQFKHKFGSVASGGIANRFMYLRKPQLTKNNTVQTYAPMATVEIGANMVRGKPGHVFYSTDTMSLDFAGYNSGATPATRTVNYEVRDLWNAIWSSGTFDVSLGAGVSATNSVTLTNIGYGHYRCAYWISGYPGRLGEVQFSRVLPPVTLSHRTNGFFGTHLLYEPWYLGSAQRLGIHWTRDFSVEKSGYALYREETEGVFNVDTNRIALARTYDIEPLINLTFAESFNDAAALGAIRPNVPSWWTNAGSGGWPLTNKVFNYVTGIVDRLKSVAAYYEIANEAVRTNIGTYDYVLEWTYKGITNVQPDAKIVGFSEYESPYNRTVLERVGTNRINFWSTHLYAYPTDQNDEIWTKQYTNNYWGFGMWMTEGGLRTESSSRINTWQFLFPEGATSEYPDTVGYMRDGRYRLTQSIHMLANVLRYPMSKWFWYDARTSGAGDKGVTYSMFDPDQTVRPIGVFLAQTAQKIEGANLKGRFSLHNKVSAFWLEKANVASVLLWATNNDQVPTILGSEGTGSTTGVTPLVLTSSLATNEFTVQDVFGNALTYGTGVTLGLDPVWVVAEGATTTNGLLASLSISTVATDTVAPRVQITHWPLTNHTGQFFWVWNGVDNTTLDVRWNGTNGVPSNVNTNSIQYRSMLTPAEGTYTAWTNTSWRLMSSVTWDTNAVFYVQAKDASGNISTNSVTITGAPAEPGGGGETGGGTGGGTSGGASPGDGGGGVDGRVRLRGLTNLRVEP